MSTCRVSDRNIDLFTLPMLWKKLVVTSWKPMIGMNIHIILIAHDARSISAGSDVNIRATNPGKPMHTANPTVVINVAHNIVNVSALRTLSGCLAP